MEHFQEKFKKMSVKLFKLIKIGLIISAVTIVLSIPYSLVKSGSPFTYLLTWLYIIATIITVLALMSTLTPGITVIRDATSPDASGKSTQKDTKESNETKPTVDDKIRNMMKKRDESWTFSLEVGMVGITIYILSTIIEIIQRSL